MDVDGRSKGEDDGDAGEAWWLMSMICSSLPAFVFSTKDLLPTVIQFDEDCAMGYRETVRLGNFKTSMMRMIRRRRRMQRR